jgi:hypothetical protein
MPRLVSRRRTRTEGEEGIAPMIKSILKWVLAALTVGVLLAACTHREVVTHGEFLGLKIGETKAEVFLRLVEKTNVSSVSPRVTDDFVVNRDNIGDLSKLANHQAFVVAGPKTGNLVYIADGKIAKFRVSYAGWQMETVSVGDSLEAALPAIKDYLLNNEGAHVFPTIKDERSVLVGEGVSIADNPEFTWLMQFDRWFFNENDRYTGTELYFSDGRLTKIYFRNAFRG